MSLSSGSGRALIVGVSGVSGYALAELLVSRGWEVTGVSRRPASRMNAAVDQLRLDVTNRAATVAELTGGGFSHVFWTTWARQESEALNRAVNVAMLRNVLDAVTPGGSVQHVALVTGLAHYAPPAAYREAPERIETPFREEQPRMVYPNFYYDLEDALFADAARNDYTWSVHRPHTIVGWALGNVQNNGVALAVYAAICREQGRPFVFPGSPQQHELVANITDAGLLAEQLAWAATEPVAADQAFNAVNGDVFRWRRMWATIAGALGVETGRYPGRARSLEEEMRDEDAAWDAIVRRYDLRPTRLREIAPWWSVDIDLGMPGEAFADMTKSRELGFHGFRRSDDSFLELFSRLRAARIIP